MTMKTEDLLNALAQSPRPGRPLGFAPVMAAIALVAAAATLSVLGLRHGVSVGLTPITMAQKTVLLLAFCATGFLMLRRAAVPVAQGAPLWQKIFAPALFALAFILDAALVPARAFTTDFLMFRFLFCFGIVTVYGALGLLAIVAVLRRYAPADAGQAGFAAGFAAASAAALGYSLHCPVDHPLYVLTAYGLPVLLLAVIARVAVPKYIRW